MMKITVKLFLVTSMLVSLTACSGNSDKMRIKDQTEQTTIQLNNLVRALRLGEMTNATILKTYASKFKTIQPEFATLADTFASQATADSSVIKDYKKRLQAIQDNPSSLGDDQNVIKELNALVWATKKDMYDDSLLDPINTIADLSDGKLQRINTPRKGADEKPATQMVGNPQYGQWQSSSNGQSLWAWYGQYALISHLLGGNRYRYNDWHYNRGWSHYNDYSRDKISTSRQRTQYKQATIKNEPALKEYGKKTGRTHSSYASRSNPTHASTVKTRAASAARASRYSSRYSGSSRSSSHSSRSRFGGK